MSTVIQVWKEVGEMKILKVSVVLLIILWGVGYLRIKENNTSIPKGHNRYKPFEGYSMIYDENTHLLWTRDIRKQATTWDNATALVAGLNRNSKHSWRIPSQAELRSLRDQTQSHKYPGNKFPIAIDTSFELSGYWVWSQDSISSDSVRQGRYYFACGSEDWGEKMLFTQYGRLLAVSNQ
jgi:hypothetical protein